MKQRLLSISMLSSSLLASALLLNACSTWGANPPPRYNQVIGERRAPVLNPGGSGVVRPVDEIAPPVGIYAQPLNKQNEQQPDAQPSSRPQQPIQDTLAPYAPAPATQYNQSMNAPASPAPIQMAQRAMPVQNAPQPTLSVESTPLAASSVQNIASVPTNSPFGIGTDPLTLHPTRVTPTPTFAQNNTQTNMFSNLAPAAGRNAPSVAVSSAPSVIADIGAMRTGEESNSSSAAWQNLPGANPLTPELSPEEKLEAQAENVLANLSPAAGGDAKAAAALALGSPTPEQVENAQKVLAQITHASAKKKQAKSELKNNATNLFAEAKTEERQDALLAVARDSRNPINSLSSNEGSAFTNAEHYNNSTNITPVRAPVANN